VEIGRTRMSVQDIAFQPRARRAVIELGRSRRCPATVLLLNRLIAHGEIVVLTGDYAVRILPEIH
jgi:flagellar motor switch/type III secretory pathway protein FliN